MQLLQIAFIVVAVSAATLASPGENYWGVTGHGYSSQYAYPSYSFDYGVHDPHTGDVKNHHESRHGDVVTGSYSLNDPDGTIRQVDYVADKHNGFNAVVKKIGHAVHPPTVQHHYGGTGGYLNGNLLHGSGTQGYDGLGFYGGLGGGESHTYVTKSTGNLGSGLYHGGHIGGATSYANSNILSFGHYGVARYAAGHYGLGGNSYGQGNSYALNHFGGGHYGGHFGGATSYANGNILSLSHFGGHHF